MDEIEQAIEAAQQGLADHTAPQQARDVDMQSRGVRAFRQRAPAPNAATCPHCGHNDNWYVWADTDTIYDCGCQLTGQPLHQRQRGELVASRNCLRCGAELAETDRDAGAVLCGACRSTLEL